MNNLGEPKKLQNIPSVMSTSSFENMAMTENQFSRMNSMHITL